MHLVCGAPPHRAEQPIEGRSRARPAAVHSSPTGQSTHRPGPDVLVAVLADRILRITGPGPTCLPSSFQRPNKRTSRKPDGTSPDKAIFREVRWEVPQGTSPKQGKLPIGGFSRYCTESLLLGGGVPILWGRSAGPGESAGCDPQGSRRGHPGTCRSAP